MRMQFALFMQTTWAINLSHALYRKLSFLKCSVCRENYNKYKPDHTAFYYSNYE